MAAASSDPINNESLLSEQMSIVHGPTDTPLLDFKLADFLDYQCNKYGSKECLIIPWTGARWTFDWLREESIWLARSLAERGIKPEDRVGIMAGNCEQYVVVFFACMRIGAILIILNNTYTAAEAHYALEFTGEYPCSRLATHADVPVECKMLFTTPYIGKQDNRKLLRDISNGRHEDLEVVILRGYPGVFTAYNSLQEDGYHLSDSKIHEYNSLFTNHDICNLQFTSGTTGHPKAAALSHQ
jgi:mevalonyl-CoA ligase